MFVHQLVNAVKHSAMVRHLKKILKAPKKAKHAITDFLGELHHKIERNKFLSNSYFTRIVIICFFLGINIQLLPFFLKTTRVRLPEGILNILNQAKIIDKDSFLVEYQPDGITYTQPSLDSNILFEKLNEQREAQDKEAFIYSDRLASVAAELLVEAEKLEFELGDDPFTTQFKTALDNANYNYEHVSQNMVVGPLLEDGVVDAWLSNKQQVKALFEDDFKEVGIATKIIKTKYNETLGVTVQVLGTELIKQPTNTISQPQIQVSQKYNFPPISNEEVFTALNSYRQSHGAGTLQVDENLCTYAQKRVQDLLAFGTLDGHEGFKKDFEDQKNLPGPIQAYQGTRIAENLAFQSCKNMTSGESFVAQTGTAIIEWCFDSSTMGHRDAQLSRDFEHACIRSAEGMFVVIFGGK